MNRQQNPTTRERKQRGTKTNTCCCFHCTDLSFYFDVCIMKIIRKDYMKSFFKTVLLVTTNRIQMKQLLRSVFFMVAMLVLHVDCTTTTSTTAGTTTTATKSLKNRHKQIIVVGSMNIDTFLPVQRLPIPGENLSLRPGCQPILNVPGGKGCTQAIAASKVVVVGDDDDDDDDCTTSSRTTSFVTTQVAFVGQFGNDDGHKIMYDTLRQHNVDIVGYQHDWNNDIVDDHLYISETSKSSCMATTTMTGTEGTPITTSTNDERTISQVHTNLCTGRGYVFQTEHGEVSAVICGGANMDGWKIWEDSYNEYRTTGTFNTEIASMIRRILLYDDDDCNNEIDGDNANIDSIQNDCDDDLNGIIMLQCEIPEYVNALIAIYCKTVLMKDHYKKWIIALDMGGEDRTVSDTDFIQHCDYIIPNEIEFKRLIQHLQSNNNNNNDAAAAILTTSDIDDDGTNEPNKSNYIVQMARWMQSKYHAKNIVITQGSFGSTLIHRDGATVLYEPPCTLLSSVVDETGAGDCYRAAFLSHLLRLKSKSNNNDDDEIQMLRQCMEYASAAGACAVERNGAIPSTPTHRQIMERIQLNKQQQQPTSAAVDGVRGGGQRLAFIGTKHSLLSKNNRRRTVVEHLRGGGGGGGGNEQSDDDNNHESSFPFLIGSRLNSMKDRPELYYNNNTTTNTHGEQKANEPRKQQLLTTPAEYVKRQSLIHGLTCVDFNYPQHFDTYWNTSVARQALQDAHLVPGAVCLRYPSPKYVRGAMNHPDPTIRQEAIQLTKDAAQAALELGCNEVVVWSAYDGYDYPFQVDYDASWEQLIIAFQECCDAYPTIKFSLEYKPTDENTRFFTVPSTGAAIILAMNVNRSNFGLTLDVGHMLMSGENPGQSIAMVHRILGPNKLFGIQLNDGYTRLAAEDGLMFGSIHPSMALEIMYQLKKIHFNGHIYFDTFPQRTDPVKEAEYNIQRVKAFWKAACQVDTKRIDQIVDEHDAIGALTLVNEALRTM